MKQQVSDADMAWPLVDNGLVALNYLQDIDKERTDIWEATWRQTYSLLYT